MGIGDWLELHWIEILTTIGIGGGSGLAGNKLSDKKRDDKIDELKLEVDENKRNIQEMKADINTNTLFDKQFRDQMKDERKEIKDSLKELKEAQSKMFDYLLNNKTG